MPTLCSSPVVTTERASTPGSWQALVAVLRVFRRYLRATSIRLSCNPLEVHFTPSSMLAVVLTRGRRRLRIAAETTENKVFALTPRIIFNRHGWMFSNDLYAFPVPDTGNDRTDVLRPQRVTPGLEAT